MLRTCIKPVTKIDALWGLCTQKLFHDVLPAAVVDFGLKELEKLAVVFALTEILGRIGVPVVLQLSHDIITGFHGLELVRDVCIVRLLQNIGARASAI